MAFFSDPEVDAKYQTKRSDNPNVKIVLGYNGPLSDVPMHFADKLFSGGTIEAKKVAKAAASTDKTDKPKSK